MLLLLLFSFSFIKEGEGKLVISTLKAKSGKSLDLLFITEPTLHPVCVPEPVNQAEEYNLALLAHEVCRKAKFKTYSEMALVHKSAVGFNEPLETNMVTCDQHQNFSTTCGINSDKDSSPEDCQYLIQMSCSSCHFHFTIKPNSSVTITSPLYPVLQPDLICEYDFFVEDGVDADMEMVVNDISLPGHEYTTGHNNHCLESLITVQAGEGSLMKEIATICGESKVYKHRGNTISAPGVSRFQLFFVSGSDSFLAGGGFRGFNVTLTAMETSSLVRKGILAAYIIIAIFVLMVISVVCMVVRKKVKESRRPRRRRVTWHGNLPRAGQSLHQERTNNLNAELQNQVTNSSNIVIEVDSNRDNNENFYNEEVTVQYSIPTRSRRRSLPTPPSPSEDPNVSVKVTVNNRTLDRTSSLGFKIYESLTSVSSDNCPNVPQRPEWTLAVPETGLTGTSPLYLMMPESCPTNTQTPAIDDKLVGDDCKENEKTPTFGQNPVPSSTNKRSQKNSVIDTAKKIFRKISESVSKQESKQKLFYWSESEDSTDNDDVFN